jgi:hypothetical protein
MSLSTVAELRATRRYLTAFLLNFPDTEGEMLVSTLLNTLDYLAEHPDEYLEIINHDTNYTYHSQDS